MSADFEFDIKAKSDLKGFQDAKEAIKDVTAATNELDGATKTLTKSQAILADKVEAQRLRERQLGANSDARAGKSLLAKELAGNVESDSGEGSAGGRSVSGLIRTVSRAVPGFSRLGQVLAALTGPLAAIAAGFVVVAGAVAAAIKGIHDFGKAQNEVRDLNTALAASGKFSQALSESIQDIANAEEKATGVGTEKWLGSLAQFVRAGATATQLGDLAKGLENLTGITGNFSEAAQLLENALRGDFEGFKKLGIIIDESGTQAEKLNQVFERATAGAGLLAAGNDDLSGSLGRLRNEATHASVTLGNLASSFALNNWAVRGTFAALGALNDWMGRTVTATGNLMANLSGINAAFVDEKKVLLELNKEIEAHNKYLDALDKSTQRKIERDKKNTEQTKAQIEHERDYKNLAIDRAQLAGALNPKQAAEAHAQNELAAQDNTRRAELAQKQRELKARQDQEAQVQAEIYRAGTASQGARQKFDHGKAVQSQIEQKAAEFKAINDSLPGLERNSEWSPAKGLDVAAAREKSNDLLKEIARLKKDRGGSLQELKLGVDKADAERDQAQKTYERSNENRARIDDLEADLKNFKASAAGQRAVTKLHGENAVAEVQAHENQPVKPDAKSFQTAEAEAAHIDDPAPAIRYFRRPLPHLPVGPIGHVEPGQFGKTTEDLHRETNNEVISHFDKTNTILRSFQGRLKGVERELQDLLGREKSGNGF